MDTKRFILVSIIVLCLFLIFILVFFDQLKHFGIYETHKEICKREVEINAIAKTMQPRINCPPLEVTITSAPDTISTKHQIAELMKDARDVYDIAWSEKDLFSEDSGVFCALYAIVDFYQKGKYVRNFEKYLRATPYSFNNEESYMDYFTGDFTYSASYSTDSLLSTDYKYAVVFMYIKEYGVVDEITQELGRMVLGENYGLKKPGSGVTGKVVAIVGGGVIAGATAAVGGAVLGLGGLTIATLGAGGTLFGSAGVGTEILKYDGKANIKSANILLVPYEDETSLQKIKCEYFPVPLGTRPQ